MAEQKIRIGVFVCECEGNISNVIDVDAICREITSWRDTYVVRRVAELCSKQSREIIVNEVNKNKLNRVIVAGCSPGKHLADFQGIMEEAKLNPYLLTMANIREHCSWVSNSDNDKATEKAISIIRGSHERSFYLEPLEQIKEKCSTEALVIGGGIAGLTTSLELANLGHTVHLVERQPSIGGHMAKLTRVFPTLDCAQSILTPRMGEVSRAKNVNLYTCSDVMDVTGHTGNYGAKILVKPTGVDREKCNGCGSCVGVCPIECPDEFNEYRSARKAIYKQTPQAVPGTYVIDFNACTKCGECTAICSAGAINLEDKEKVIELTVGGIIIATGYELFDASKITEYEYGVNPDVITMLELERMTSPLGPTQGKIVKFSDGKEAKSIAIGLCAGSRDANRFIPYCSHICCMYSITKAILLREEFGIDVSIFYIDIRAAGRGYEDLYWRAQDSGVDFVKGKIAEIRKSNGKTIVRAEDLLLGEVIEQEFDLVALAVPMIPSWGTDELALKMRLPLADDRFIQEKHPGLEPLNSRLAGIFMAGCASGPKDIRDTVADALGAAAKTSSFLDKGYIVESPEKAFVIPELCDGCGLCLEVCPFSAIELTNGKIEISPFRCSSRCGACIPECPKGAIDFRNATRKQIFSTIKGIMAGKKPGEVRLIALVEKNIAYMGTELLGATKMGYPHSIRIVAIPSAALIGLEHVLNVFAMGADGVILIEGQPEMDTRFMKKRTETIRSFIQEQGIESKRLYYELVELLSYRKLGEIFNEQANLIQKQGSLPDQVIEKLKSSEVYYHY